MKSRSGVLAQNKKDTHYHNYFFYYYSLGLWGEALAVLLPRLLHPPVHLLPLHLLLSSPEIRMNMGAQMNCFGRLNWTKSRQNIRFAKTKLAFMGQVWPEIHNLIAKAAWTLSIRNCSYFMLYDFYLKGARPSIIS